MVPVRIEGVRRNFGISSAYMYSVTLIDEAEQRLFVFGVERYEALPIVAALHNLPLPRPQTINAMVDTLKFNCVTLAEVRIEDFNSLSFVYLLSTTLLWRNSDGSESGQKLDLRPADALGLVALTSCPLFISDKLAERGVRMAQGKTPEIYMIEDLLRREGITLSEGKKLRLGHSKTPMRDALVKEFKASLLGKAPPFPEEDMEQRKQELLTFLLGENT